MPNFYILAFPGPILNPNVHRLLEALQKTIDLPPFEGCSDISIFLNYLLRGHPKSCKRRTIFFIQGALDFVAADLWMAYVIILHISSANRDHTTPDPGSYFHPGNGCKVAIIVHIGRMKLQFVSSRSENVYLKRGTIFNIRRISWSETDKKQSIALSWR